MHAYDRARIGSRLTAAIGAAVLAALVLLAPAGAQQERIAIRGTSVTMIPPPGFTASRTERGVENTATGSTITISEQSGEAYASLAERFSSAKSLTEGYAEQKITIRGIRRIDGKIPFAIGQQVARGKTFVKYLALLQGDKTVLVTFTIGDRAFTEADAEAVVRSIELTPEPTLEERLAPLPFTFRAVEPYSIAEVIQRQAARLEVEGDAAQPAIVIGYGRSQALMGDEARVAVELLRGTGGYREAQITAQEAVPFAGGDGYVVTAVVENRTVVQYLRIIPGGGYLRLLARGDTSAMQGAEAVIQEIASSVEPR
jgi:hypothetical protein